MPNLGTSPIKSQKNKQYLQTARWAIANWSIVLSGLLFYSGLNALTLIIVARRVTPTEYGQYLACFALSSFLVILPGFGMDAWLLTQSGDTRRSAAGLWASSMRTRFQLLALWIIAMIPLAIILPDDTYPPAILLPTIIGVALDSLLLLSYAAMRNRSQHGKVALLQAISGLALLGLTLLLPLEDGQIALFALARTLLSLLLVLIVVGYLGREYLKLPSTLMPTRRIMSLSRPFMWAELASSVYVRADLTIISLVLGAVGTSVYGPAVTILQASFPALRALFFLIVPVLARTYTRNRDEFLNQSLAQTVVQFLAGTTISIFLFIFAEQIINLIFTSEYEESVRVLRLLSPIPFFRSINFALGAILTSSNRQYRRTRVQISAAIFNVVGNLIVIVPFGIVGVTVVYIFSEVFLSVGYTLLVQELKGQLKSL